MACDASGMDHVRARQTLLGEEPIYCAAYDDDEDILYLGADESLNHQARVARRLRYEEQALRYLRGQRPRLLSAALQGPFDRASGWRNPWLPQNQVSKTRETIQDPPATDIPTQKPPMTVAVANTASRVEPEILGAKVHQTPATRDSIQCHLPSPDSHRELELADEPQFDLEARSRIQAWARNISADTFERDEFWAPDDGTGSVSDTSIVSKRPAGKEWLRSKLNKRRRTGNNPFATLGTPTPAPVPAMVASAAASSKARRTSQINMTASKSFEHTTPASSAGQSIEESFQRPSSTKTVDESILASKNEPNKYNVAVKASALRKAVIKKPRQVSKTSSRNAAHERLMDLPHESPRLANDPVLQSGSAVAEQHSQIAPTSSNAPAEFRHKDNGQNDNSQPHIPPEHHDNPFESCLDRSFQYKARTTKHDAPKLTNENAFMRQSQPTQTGTPESEDHENALPTQRQAAGGLDMDHDNLVQQTLEQIEEMPKDQPERQQDDSPKPIGPRRTTVSSSNTNNHGHDAMSSSSLEENVTRGDTTLPGHSVDSDNIQGGAPQPSPTCQIVSSADRLEDTQCSVLDSKRLKFTKSPFKPASHHSPARRVSEPLLNIDATNIPVRASSHIEPANTPTESAERWSVVSFHGAQPREREDILQRIESRPYAAIAERTTLIASQDSAFAQPVPFNTDETAPQQQPQSATTNEHMSDNMSDTGHSVIMVPISQAEWVITETADVAKRTVEETILLPHSRPIKIEPTAEREGEFAVSYCTNTLPNSLVADGCEIKTEPVEEEEWVSCLRPISLTSSPADVTEQHELPLSQQGYCVLIGNESGHAAGLQASRLLQDSIASGSSPSQLLKEQQSPWNAPTNLVENADGRVVLYSSRSGFLQPSVVDEVDSPNAVLQQVSGSSDIALKPTVPESAQPSMSSNQLATPFQLDARRPTPELNLSIKSFATFNTPSPKRRRASKHRIASGDRLPSTQLLTNAVNSNPWSSVRSSFRSSLGSRSQLRVSFAPLPDDDNDGDKPDELLRPAARAAASPPPQSTPDPGDEVAGDHFHKHFDAVRQKSAASINPTGFRLAPRLLPSESQQVPLSPEIGMMAQAFKEADLVQIPRSSPEPSIALDEVPDEVYDEHNARLQSPWRIESQSEGVDDVAAVLQNLDAYLNPRWDVEAEMGKAQGGDGIENQRRSPGLFEDNVWG